MSADRSATIRQFWEAFAVYKPSVGNYHSAKRGIDSARAAGVIEDSYRRLVRLAANLGLPTMPPKYKPVGMQGEWGGWSEWLNDVNVWQIEAEARLAAAEARVGVDFADLPSVPPLDENSVNVLLHLSEMHPCLRKRADIEAATDLTLPTIRSALKKLADFVCRPNGERSGVTLNEQGRALAARVSR